MFTRILADRKIEEAMANGEFEDLPLKGQKIDLDEYFSMPPEWRAGYAVLKNARVVPPEVDLMREAEALRERLTSPRPGDDSSLLRQKLREKELSLRVRMEARRRSR